MKKLGISILATVLFCGLPGTVWATMHSGEISEQARESVPDHVTERVPAQAGFTDTDDDYWAEESVEKMQTKGIFQGYDDGTFRPSNPVTRMQTIITAVRLLGLEEEAQEKDLDTSISFADADHYFKDGRNEWAKGYVLVALEQGLFDTNETALNANEPAKRVWVASTLVRALELEEEALEAMTQTPDFQDADAIPAGAVGYANIADEYDIVNGTEEGLFQPNESITRAQMATVLDRTYDNWLEEEGAHSVQGELVHLDAKERLLTLKTENEETSYSYGDDFSIGFQGRYIEPDQLQEGDFLSLQLLDNKIEDAHVITEVTEGTPETGEQEQASGILDVKVEVEYRNDDEIELKYEKNGNHEEAKLEEETGDEDRELKGKEALSQVQQYLDEWALDAEMTTDEAVSSITESLDNTDQISEVEIKVAFANGPTFKHEQETSDEDNNDDEDDEEEDENEEEDEDDE
ncbi:S-layer homology domain-containing protein [Salibacterium salarium]|nr:S-layer homology domain-containing protein [Salibacterium salarium]